MSETKSQKAYMPYVFLGKTGLRVSQLCLGGMTLGTTTTNAWGLSTADKDDSFALLDEFVAAGGNFIDTADCYGSSEDLIGLWLTEKKIDREKLVIATKVRAPLTGKDGKVAPNDVGLSRKHIMAGVKRSLKRMQIEYIDLLQVHFYDYQTPLEETFAALNDLVRTGLVHYIGLSNYSAWQIQKVLGLCAQRGWASPVSIQPQYSLLARATEWDIVPLAQEAGLAVMPWSPLCGGWLTGRYDRNTVLEKVEDGSRVKWAEKANWEATDFSHIACDKTFALVDVMRDIAKECERSVAQVALRWLIQKPGGCIPIVGSRKLKNLKDNLAAVTFELTKEQMDKLDKASAVRVPYPWGLEARHKAMR